MVMLLFMMFLFLLSIQCESFIDEWTANLNKTTGESLDDTKEMFVLQKTQVSSNRTVQVKKPNTEKSVPLIAFCIWINGMVVFIVGVYLLVKFLQCEKENLEELINNRQIHLNDKNDNYYERYDNTYDKENSEYHPNANHDYISNKKKKSFERKKQLH